MHNYAVKYIDENGYTTSTGYITCMEEHKAGEILTAWNGKKIMIDFEI